MGLTTFVEVGEALLGIRDRRLYRETHRTFEDYCRERWGMSKAYAHRHVQAAEVIAGLSPMGDKPASERQARELAPLKDKPVELAEAWSEAQDEANGKPTAEDVRRAVAPRLGVRCRCYFESVALGRRAANLANGAPHIAPGLE